MIYLDLNGAGYFRGDRVTASGYDFSEDLLELRFVDGHRKGERIHQPIECVVIARDDETQAERATT